MCPFGHPFGRLLEGITKWTIDSAHSTDFKGFPTFLLSKKSPWGSNKISGVRGIRKVSANIYFLNLRTQTRCLRRRVSAV